MPSKRTNDSVDRILADLNQRQAADGVRASVTDHQVDEILRSVGISTTPLQNTPTQDSQIAFSDFSGPDDFDEIMRSAGATSAPASMPAPAPRRTAETPTGRAATVYGDLVSAAEALLALARESHGRPNKELAAFASQIRALMAKQK